MKATSRTAKVLLGLLVPIVAVAHSPFVVNVENGLGVRVRQLEAEEPAPGVISFVFISGILLSGRGLLDHNTVRQGGRQGSSPGGGQIPRVSIRVAASAKTLAAAIACDPWSFRAWRLASAWIWVGGRSPA